MSRAYGWAADGVAIVDTEAAVLRHMADWVTGGGTLRGLVDDLNQREVSTLTGKPWQPIVIKRSLMNPRMIGKREVDGELVDTNAAPILDRRQWQQIVDLFSDPERAKFAPTKTRTALLAGGLAKCGKCGSDLYANATVDRANIYSCSVRSGGCGSISIVGDLLEADATERVLARLTDARYRRALGAALNAAGGVDAAQRRLDDFRARLATLGEDFADGVIERDTLLAGTKRVVENIGAAEADVARATVLVDLPEPTVDDVIAWWEEAPHQRRRDVIGVLLDHVTVLSARGEDARSGTDRLVYQWK